MYEYQFTVIRVVDGDTIHANVDLGCDTHLNLTVRLYGIDAPELGTESGQAAKAWLDRELAARPVWVMRTIKDHREKYGRYLGLIVRSGEVTVNDDMVTAGHAVHYDGGKRQK